MAGSAYPHIVFATNEQTLPKTELESLLRDLFADHEPPPATRQGALEVVLELADYAFTFWYDDEAEGLGARYASFAPPMKHRRISKCTTMIDFSGGPDPERAYAAAADTIATALAERVDTYVFSEATRLFVAMDYTDPFTDPGPVAPAPAAVLEPVLMPEPQPTTPKPLVEPAPPRRSVSAPSSPFAPAAAWAPAAREPQRPRTSIGQVPVTRTPAGESASTTPSSLIGRVPVADPAVQTATPTPAAEPAPPRDASSGHAEERPTAERYSPPFTAPDRAPGQVPTQPAPWPEPGEAARPEPQDENESDQQGIFKRVFGRRKESS